MQDDAAPPRTLLFLFGVMGTGILLPWNTFISGADYFEELYPCAHIEFKFAIAYMASLMIFMLLCVLLGHLLSLGTRVVFGYVLLLLSMLGSLPVRSQSAHIFMVVLTGIGDALVQGSMCAPPPPALCSCNNLNMYGVAGSFPPLFMRSLMMGTAVAGVIVSAIRVFSKLVSQENQSSAFFIFIALSSVIVVVCIVAWFMLRRHPYSQTYLANCGTEEDKRRSLNEVHMKEKAAGGDTALDASAPDHATSERDEPCAAEDDESGLLHPPSAAGGAVAGDTAAVGSGSLSLKQRVSLIVELLRGPLLPSAAAVAGNFGITLALFPGVLTEMRSSNKSLDDWFVTLLVACFNVFDCVGRMLLSVPALVPQRNPNRWLIVLMLMRLMFFPLFLWRALPSFGNNSDAYAFVVVALFSASNGFVGTLAMQEGPRYCKEKDRELAGTVLAFCLMVGLNSGAQIGDVLNAVWFSKEAAC